MKILFVVFTAIFLTACQSKSSLQALPYQHLWQDQHFKTDTVTIETPAEIFYLPPEVIEKAGDVIYPYRTPRERSIALLKFIFRDASDPLSYVNSATLTAWQTYQTGEANCLSLTILSYSLASQLGFKTQFRDVKIPEYWITRRGNSFLNGHVNLQVAPPFPVLGDKITIAGEQNFTVDFELDGTRDSFAYKRLSEQQVVALFYNNKAADALWQQRYDEAYQYLKAAAAVAPELAVTWNNLAILYRYKTLLNPAEQAYLHALQLQPEQSNTMANLAMLYNMTGRQAESAALMHKVEKMREKNPYYYLMLGNEALLAGQDNAAKSAYLKGIRLDPRNAEIYLGLAQIAYRQGAFSEAIEQLEKARRYAGNHQDEQRFQGKLAWVMHEMAKPH